MSSHRPHRFIASAIALAYIVSIASLQPARADDDAGAQPGVARVAAIRGSVTITRADSNDGVAAVLNAPVLGADYVSTAEGARAELQLDSRTAVRLDENTQMRFTSLAADKRELQLAVGTIDLGVFGERDRPQIDTPTVSVRPTAAGDYRVTVTQDGQTQITVRRGAAQVTSPQGNQDIAPGSTLLALGSAEQPTISIVREVATDEFDRYAEARDGEIRSALANAYVNPDVQGAQDLDRVGRWVVDPQYGHVWVPPVQSEPNWAPYQSGRWAWEDAYGWTWIAAEPWGWAPYHYGRWYHSPVYGWAWYPPPPLEYRPLWQPALVAFLGFNIGAVRVGFGFGNIGWVPLAPGELYHPWYGYGSHSVTNVTNVTNITNVTNNYGTINHYRNTLVTNGVTAVSQTNFQAGNFGRRVALDNAAIRQGRAFAGAVPIVPNANHLRYASTGAVAGVGPRPIVQRTFAGNAVPVERVPFGVQRREIATVTHAAYTPDARYPTAPRVTTAITRPNPGLAPVPSAHTAPAAAGAVSSPWDRFDRGTSPGGRPQRGYTAPTNRVAPARAPSDAFSRFPQRGSAGGNVITPTQGQPVRRPSYAGPGPYEGARHRPDPAQPQQPRPAYDAPRPASGGTARSPQAAQQRTPAARTERRPARADDRRPPG